MAELASPLSSRTAAVLVVYRLKAPLEQVLEALTRAVALTVVVDNSEHGHDSLVALVQRPGVVLLRGANRGALAGAYNMALTHLRAHHTATFEQIVFLDDDSDASLLGDLLGDQATALCLGKPDTAAVAPAYRDRATGLRGKYIELGRWRLVFMQREFSDLRRVAFVINSMSVWRWSALERIGPFSEDLAIDHVDTEYCLRARSLGLKVYVHGGHVFAHSIGERRRFRFLGRDMQAGGHAPARRFLIGRNTLWLARAWVWREPAFAFLCLTRLAYEIAGILLAEDCVSAKLAALLRGAAVGAVTSRRP